MRSGLTWVLCAAVVSVLPGLARADVSDSFSTDNGNWTHTGDTVTPPAFHATGGNPGGYITIDDSANGTGDFFIAPARYLGNQSSALNQTLSFDLLLSNAADGASSDVALSNGPTTLVYVFPTLPTTTGSWIHESMTVGTSDPNWHLSSPAGAAPTLNDFQNVLGSLTVFEVLGDYRAGPETVGLDNVTLVQAPEPACLTLLAFSGVGLCARRRRHRARRCR
jgi:hypothetical protein